MADVIPEKESLLLKLALGLFLFSNLCSPPEASSRLLGTEGAPDSIHRRLTWDSEAGVHLRLCYYSPWKGSKLSEDLWGQGLSGTGISKGILLSEVEIAGESCKNPGTPWMAGKAELRNALAVSGALIHMFILLSWVLEPMYSQHPTSQAARQGWSESLASTFKRAPEASVGLGGFSHTWALVG